MSSVRYKPRRARLPGRTGLTALVLPVLPALALERGKQHRHKDVYEHTLTVVEQAMDLETSRGGPAAPPDFVGRFAALMEAEEER